VSELVLAFDGASRGNPGPAASAFVVRQGGMLVIRAEPIGEATCNVAEYEALRAGLDYVLTETEGATALRIYSDSKLVVRQVNGAWKCRDQALLELRVQVRARLAFLSEWSLEHIPGERNRRADQAANEALDADAPIEHREAWVAP
jgi:ribonuclease HI